MSTAGLAGSLRERDDGRILKRSAQEQLGTSPDVGAGQQGGEIQNEYYKVEKEGLSIMCSS